MMSYQETEVISFTALWIVLRKKVPILLLISFLCALIVYGFTARIKPSYEVHYSYLVSLSNRDTSPDFRFDGYYALQATDLFSATVARLTTTPETIVKAYEKAGIVLPSRDPRQLGKSIEAEKTAPQLVEVTVKDESEGRAEELAQALRFVMNETLRTYQGQSIPDVQFSVVMTEPWTGVINLSQGILSVATFGFVLFFGINAVLLYTGFRYGL